MDINSKNRVYNYCEKDSLQLNATYKLQNLDRKNFHIYFANKLELKNDTNIKVKPSNINETSATIYNLKKDYSTKKKIYILARNGGTTCPLKIDSITITNFKKPEIISVGKDDTICTSTINLEGKGIGYKTGIWTEIKGTKNIVKITDSTSIAKSIRDSLNIFQWTVKNGACTDSARVKYLIGDSLSKAEVLDTSLQICDSSFIHLKSKPFLGQGVWLINNNIIPGSSTTNRKDFKYTVLNNKDFKEDFIWRVSNDLCFSQDTMKLTYYKAPTTAIAGQPQSLVKNNYTLQGNKPNVGIGQWEIVKGTAKIENETDPNSEIRQLNFGENILKWTISNGTCPVSSDIITITYSDFNIPSGFSPNGDNKNDLFEIKGIESYPGTQLKVFNRWGMLVYSSADYQNQWDGDGLSDDTYYYELKITGSKEKHGYILLKRK